MKRTSKLEISGENMFKTVVGITVQNIFFIISAPKPANKVIYLNNFSTYRQPSRVC
jgi:hypothetical protein